MMSDKDIKEYHAIGKEKESKNSKTPPKIPVNILNWGPCVMHFRISEEFHKMLVEDGAEMRSQNRDYRMKLAGHIKEEYSYSDLNKYVPYLSRVMKLYEEAVKMWRNSKVSAPDDNKYFLKSLWINYQNENEYNPPHNHSERYSFVIYLDIPEALQEENKNYVGTSTGPGSIVFTYGEGNSEYITFQSYFPVARDMFVFPSTLTHYVAPFQAKCERISVSGNVLTDIPLNIVPEDMEITVLEVKPGAAPAKLGLKS